MNSELPFYVIIGAMFSIASAGIYRFVGALFSKKLRGKIKALPFFHGLWFIALLFCLLGLYLFFISGT